MTKRSNLMVMTRELAFAAGTTAADIRMHKAGRTKWNDEEVALSIRTTNKLLLYVPAEKGGLGAARTMKLGFCPFFDLLSAEAQVQVDVSVEWDKGFPKLVINDVLDSTGKVSLIHNDDKLFQDIGYRIASQAEDDERLLARAVEQDEFERAA